MPIWERNPYSQQDPSAWMNDAAGISPLGPSSDPLTPGRNDGPDDPPESGAPENSANGGFDLFNVDWGAQDFDPDIERMGRMYQDLYGSEPPSSLYQPAQVNYDPMRSALRQASQAEQKAIQQAQDEQQERLEKRQFQTLWTALGPEVFNAFSGAGVNTGFERSLALQQKAEQRAAELDRELGLREAEQTREDLTRRAQLQIEEQQTNAQREREAARQEYEDERAREQALLEGYAGLQQAQSERDAAEAELQQEAQQAQREYQTDLRQDTVDLISELDDDPQLAPQVAAQIQALNPDWSDQQVKARVGQMLRASQQGGLNAEQEGGALVQGSAQNPVSLVDNLVNSTLSLKEEYDQTDNLSPGWEGRDRTRPASSTASGREGDYLTDLEGKRQALVYQLGRAANEAEQRAYDLQKAGVQVPAEITNQISALNTAREKLKQVIVEEGADADNVEEALKPVRSAVATLSGAQSQQGDALRSNPATAPYIAAYEGASGAQARTASSEEEGDEASSADPVRDVLNEVENDPALRAALGMGQSETPSSESTAQGAEEQGDGASSNLPTVTADELIKRVEQGNGYAGNVRQISNLLRAKGLDLDSDQVPVVQVEQDGETQVVAGVEQIATLASEMSGSESKRQVLRNFATPFRAIYEDITTPPDVNVSPENALKVRYGVQPGADVRVQEVGGGNAILVVDGKPGQPMRAQKARQRLSEIRTLQARVEQR